MTAFCNGTRTTVPCGRLSGKGSSRPTSTYVCSISNVSHGFLSVATR